MGNSIYSLMGGITKDKKVMISGLDYAGKTTLLYKMKLGEVVTTFPTIGMNIEKVQYKSMEFLAHDVGGRCSMHALLKYITDNTTGIIFVVDANDRERLEWAHDELQRLLTLETMADVPLLILLNKQDLKGAISPDEFSALWKAKEERDKKRIVSSRQTLIQPCSVIVEEGISEGMLWLTSQMNPKPKEKQTSMFNEAVSWLKYHQKTGTRADM